LGAFWGVIVRKVFGDGFRVLRSLAGFLVRLGTVQAAVRTWSERRGGELLRGMAVSGERESRGGDRKSKLHDATLKLDDLGITRVQSHRWQRMAQGRFEKMGNGERPDPGRHGGQVLDLDRCAGCRNLLDDATKEEWATSIGFASQEEAESMIVFYICKSCFDRTQTEPGFVFANRIDVAARQWHEMNISLGEFKGEPIDEC